MGDIKSDDCAERRRTGFVIGELTVSTTLVKPIGEAHESGDGAQFLADQPWPKGVRREALALQGWLRGMARSLPSNLSQGLDMPYLGIHNDARLQLESAQT